MPEIKRINSAGEKYFAQVEGCKLKPYRDSAGIPTIGIGCTYYENGKRVRMSDPIITLGRAISLFRKVVRLYELTVYSTTRDDINQNQFNALVSICYNIGPGEFKRSTLLKVVNKDPDDPQIRNEFAKWKYSGGKPVLVERRRKDANLYFTPVL